MKAVARDAQPTNPAGLPSVDRILSLPETKLLVERFGRELVVNAVRELLQAARKGAPIPDWTSDLQSFLEEKSKPRLRRVINLTGTVLHTNLGRALLPDEAVQAAVLAMKSACNLEYDVDSGERGDRDDLVEIGRASCRERV